MDMTIYDTGISIVHEPDVGSPVVDIVIVHGLQGHPYKTWACKDIRISVPPAARLSDEAPGDGNSSHKSHHRVVPRFLGKSSGSSSIGPDSSQRYKAMSSDGGDFKGWRLFWPKDLLPVQYPNARVLVYGYDTRVTNYLSGPTNENSIHSHGKDLLSSLAAFRKLDSPLIIIAHSLGGIVVKEMLGSSSNSTEDRLRNVVASTAAVMFLGTPHRGSADLAKLGDRARKFISALRVKTSPAILDALSLKTNDLERAQESFSVAWSRYDFRVKTFQEGLGLTGLNLGPFGKKVVPDFSSLLGDDRERAETIQANHMEMCRFRGLDDPNYARLCGEITSVYDWLASCNGTTVHRLDSQSFTANTRAMPPRKNALRGASQHEKICLQSLLFPNMNKRVQNLESPAEGTCSWLFKHETFVDWLTNKNQTNSCGLLRLRGKPGSGKSTLLRETFFRSMTEMSSSQCHVASFFFDAKGGNLEHSSSGMLRSILHQMCSKSSDLLGALSEFAQGRCALHGEDMASWEEAELRDFFKSAAISHGTRTVFFIDAIDECDPDSMRDVVDFWRTATKAAHRAGVQLSVCLSSRDYPAVTINDCSEIVMEDHNYADIANFVSQRLEVGMSGKSEDRQAIQQKILNNSEGVFLWVSLVVKDVLRKSDEGRGLESLLKDLDSVPRELGDLFCQLLTEGESRESQEESSKVFQWALLPAKPLRLHEWHHILAFIGDKPPSSLHEWRQSGSYTETDEQLEKRITHLSRGLLRFNVRGGDALELGNDWMSDQAYAGSLDLKSGETRVVQVIHESLRQYFLKGPGFAVLNPELATKPLAHAHHSMMRVCLNYIWIAELDALVKAREQASERLMKSRHARDKNERSHIVRLNWISTPVTTYALWLSGLMSTRTAQAEPSANNSRETRRSVSPPSRPGSPASVASFGSASSHEGRQGATSFERAGYPNVSRLENGRGRKRPRRSESPSPAPPKRKSRGDEVHVYDSLKQSSGPIESYDVAKWRLKDISVAVQACDDVACTRASPSVTGCTEVLEDYPALLSYATFELFTHAKKADAENLDPRHMIELFRGGDTWRRWSALREDISHYVGLLDLVADLGFSSWLKAEGAWKNMTKLRAMKRAIKSNNTRALGNLLDAFPSTSRHPMFGPALACCLACAPDTDLLAKYISRHPSQRPRQILYAKDGEKRTTLHLAVSQQNTASVSLLLKLGADVLISAVDSMLRTPLHLACMGKARSANKSLSENRTVDDVLAPRCDIIELLLDHGADINATDAEGCTPLLLACSNNTLPFLQDTGEDFADTESQSEHRSSNAVELLLERGANATTRDPVGFLPLHYACWNSSGGRQSKGSIVSKLLDYGSPVNAKSVGYGTPLHIACCCVDVASIEALLHHGADPLLQDDDGRSPLHVVTEHIFGLGPPSILPWTFADATDSFASLHHEFSDTRNDPLHESVVLIIRLLLAHGAKAYTLRDNYGASPADFARRNGIKKALKMMAEESCDAPPRESTEGEY